MKCSDCGRYKTKECYANPTATDWDMAENYSCFIQRADGAPVPPVMPIPTVPSGMVVPERQSTSKSLLRIIGIALAVALVAAITYCVVITRDRDTLNTELESVEAVLASTQAELSSTKQGLTLIQTELSATKQTLISVQNELMATKAELEDVEAKLKFYNETLGVEVFSDRKKIIEKGGGGLQEINLIDNPSAANPTWQELKEFLLADPTDDKTYIKDIFDCSQFAEMLHNKAETQGIKAAYVGVKFRESDIGHALNAFRTTDRGLVYVDCTGKGLFQGGTSEEWDKIAYLVKGKEYGTISVGLNTPLNYSSYEKMKIDWDSYGRKLEAYNSRVTVYNMKVRLFNLQVSLYEQGFGEWWQIEEQKETLERLEEELDDLKKDIDDHLAQLEPIWEPLGVVTNIQIYW